MGGIKDDNGVTGDAVAGAGANTMKSPDKLKKQVIEIGKKLKECQDDSSSPAFKDLLEEYFGIGGKGKEPTLQAKVPCAKWLNDNEEWTKLGKLLIKWLYVRNEANAANKGWAKHGGDTNNGEDRIKMQLKHYDAGALGLAKGILCKGRRVRNLDNTKTLTIGGGPNFWSLVKDGDIILKGVVGVYYIGFSKALSDSDNAGKNNHVDFDNMIWCNDLPTNGDIIIPNLQNDNRISKGDLLLHSLLQKNNDGSNCFYVFLSVGLFRKGLCLSNRMNCVWQNAGGGLEFFNGIIDG